MKDLSDATKALPCNTILQGVDHEESVFRAKGYAVVHKGDYRGVEVAVTIVQELDHTPHVSQVRPHNTTFMQEHYSSVLLKWWRRQVVSWRQLNHENITKIIGVCQDVPYSLVSEFQPQTNMREHLTKCKTEDQPPNYVQLVSADAIRHESCR